MFDQVHQQLDLPRQRGLDLSRLVGLGHPADQRHCARIASSQTNNFEHFDIHGFFRNPRSQKYLRR